MISRKLQYGDGPLKEARAEMSLDLSMTQDGDIVKYCFEGTPERGYRPKLSVSHTELFWDLIILLTKTAV
jgi:hypothetical protein